MKKITTNQKSYLSVVIATLLLFAVTGCSRKINFATSSVVPAAQGAVKFKKDNNGNQAIEVNISHLAEAKRLQPARDVYVVWIDTQDSGIKNLGQLRSSSGLFSNTRKASLKAVTAFKPVRLFVTAENTGDIRYPGNMEVLTTGYFNRN